MIYKLVASSRSRVTEVYEGEDKTLVQVYHYKSGRIEASHVTKIPQDLTVRYNNGDIWETDPIPSEGIIFPAIR